MNECANSRAWPAWAEQILAVLAIAAAAAAAPPDAVFRVEGQRPAAAVITVGESWDDELPLDTAMGRFAAGVLSTYDTRSVATLLRCATRRPVPPDAVTHRVAVIHLAGHRPEAADRRVELMRLDDGEWAARPLPMGAGVLLDADRFDAVRSDWPVYRGGLEGSSGEPIGSSSALERPYVAGAVTLDARTQKQRLYRGMPVRALTPDRVLDEETMHVRLPAGYDPRKPAGLLVWSSPTARGSIPDAFGPALDELNMVCIGSDNTGNDRDVPDKFQLVFDAVATARQRFHIDDDRIYITGMSGGGKVTSILATCFPDVFMGSIPIVGLGSYTELDDSWGQHRYAYFAEPRGRLLQLARQHRMAPMGGPPDFNYREMTERVARLEADGFTNIRFFSYPDMAHVMPTPQRFAEAMRWVDAPARAAGEQRDAGAAALLAEYIEGRVGAAPVTGEDHAALAKVIEAAPWSDAAWRALELRKTPSP